MQDVESPSAEFADWDLIIRPRRGWLDVRFSELWHARELISLFVWRDFIALYKQTVLGPLWYIVQPLIVALTYFFVFGNIARLPTEGTSPFLFYLSGIVLWSYFSANFTKTSATFLTHVGLFAKVYFPRLIVPVSIVLSNLISFGIQFGIFLIFVLGFALLGVKVEPNLWLLTMPLLILIMAGLGLGFGIIVSALTTRYRDLQHVVNFGSQLLLFVTPVIYPMSAVPESYRNLLWLNPIAPVMETFRFAFFGTGITSATHLIYSFAVMMAIVCIGLLLFNQAENTFMDTV